MLKWLFTVLKNILSFEQIREIVLKNSNVFTSMAILFLEYNIIILKFNDYII